jgi:hypothetical protein
MLPASNELEIVMAIVLLLGWFGKVGGLIVRPCGSGKRAGALGPFLVGGCGVSDGWRTFPPRLETPTGAARCPSTNL